MTPLSEKLNALASRLDRAHLKMAEPIAPYTTFRIGGPADLFYTTDTADDLARAITAARDTGVPWFVLGLGANILVGDRGFRGIVIHNRAQHHTFSDDGRLWCESGAIVADIVLESVNRGWSGFEHYVGIPSTIGGAIWQNLHFLSPAPERERTMFIAEVFESCEILSEEGERRTVGADYVNFGYDDTVFHHRRDVVLAATFRLAPADPGDLHRIMQENLAWRGARHPWLDWGRPVAPCGMTAARGGAARSSHMHANIMVNLGSATAAEVRELIATAQRRVKEKFGHELEPEIGFVGEF